MKVSLEQLKSYVAIPVAPEELCEVEGIGKAQAKVIWDYYHRKEE